MSKVKQMHMKQLEDEFELELSYKEWLRDNFSEPSEDELNGMEEDSLKSSTEKNHIITHYSLIPANNIDFFPPYSA